jgi:hypothetical protein
LMIISDLKGREVGGARHYRSAGATSRTDPAQIHAHRDRRDARHHAGNSNRLTAGLPPPARPRSLLAWKPMLSPRTLEQCRRDRRNEDKHRGAAPATLLNHRATVVMGISSQLGAIADAATTNSRLSPQCCSMPRPSASPARRRTATHRSIR